MNTSRMERRRLGVALTALGWVWRRAWYLAGAASFCVAGVALGDMDLRQAWRLVTWTFTGTCGSGLSGDALGTWLAPPHSAWQAWRLVAWTSRFVWQAWHLVTWTFTLCGRRGTYGTGLGLWTTSMNKSNP
eukprot:s2039_g10.t1